MVKQYLRYAPGITFGIVASMRSNSIYTESGNHVFLPSLEKVKQWDIKRGIEISSFEESEIREEVSCLERSSDGRLLAVGYTNGSIRVWEIETQTCSIIFNGHRSEVTSLKFDFNNLRLVSGSKDTDIIVWDIVNECGLYRLRGHVNQINGVTFVRDKEYLISVSKDTFIKVWDLTTQHCVQTIVGHHSEITSMHLHSNRGWLFTGSNDDFKLWDINVEAMDQGLLDMDDNEVELIKFKGLIERVSKNRITQITVDKKGEFVLMSGNDKTIELYRIRTFEEIKKKISRRLRRLKEKNKLKEDIDINSLSSEDITASDYFLPIHTLRLGERIRSFDLHPTYEVHKKGHIQILISLMNNSVEVHQLPIKEKQQDKNDESIYALELPGHRSEVRAVAISSDDELVVSCSKQETKVWNVKTGLCVRTLECENGICCKFLPGDRHVVVGTKSGLLELFDIAAGTLIESFEAHEGAVWSIDVSPDKNSIVTGSADKDVKFWDLDTKSIVDEDGTGHVTRQLTLTLTKTLQMSDDVLCVKYSPNQNLLAVSMIDTTVKVFFTDSLKLFLSLYGHKLPVISMDISSDNHLIVTGSADKNIKIWGLDFGDCHKSLFGHQESILAVQFVRDTHYFFSCSKDKLIKYWDGDKFENIMKLEGHHAEVWGMALSHYGQFLVTGSADRSLRVWERTDEPLFLEEEKEKELEALFEASLLESKNKENKPNAENEIEEVGKATNQTLLSLKSGELIMEAIELADKVKEDWLSYEKSLASGKSTIAPPQHPILQALKMDYHQYVLSVVTKIKSTDLEDALLILPFSKVISLIYYLNYWANKNWNTPLVCRILLFLIKVHHKPIVANRVLKPTLEELKNRIRAHLNREKTSIGYNLAGLNFQLRAIKYRQTEQFFGEEEVPESEVKSVKRKAVV